MEGRRRVTLYDQMSTVDGCSDTLAGSTLEAVMASHKIASEQNRRQFSSSSRTLSDIIREDKSNAKDKKSWKVFKNKLWLKRAGSTWFSAINIPALDSSIPNRNNSNPDAPSTSNPPEFSSQILARARPSLSAAFSGESTHQTSRPNSFRRDGSVTFQDYLDSDGDGDRSECDDWDPTREGTRRLSTILSEERALSAREAEAAATVAATSSASAPAEEDEPVRMSLTLMDLLEETDRQMGFTGSEEDDDEEVYKRMKMEKEEDEDAEEEEGSKWSVQESCCVCMVRHKGAAFIPCGHTFCRQCSRELWVSRGHCPLCNNVILEILDLF